jgi:hypothetical protein
MVFYPKILLMEFKVRYTLRLMGAFSAVGETWIYLKLLMALELLRLDKFVDAIYYQ